MNRKTRLLCKYFIYYC